MQHIHFDYCYCCCCCCRCSFFSPLIYSSSSSSSSWVLSYLLSSHFSIQYLCYICHFPCSHGSQYMLFILQFINSVGSNSQRSNSNRKSSNHMKDHPFIAYSYRYNQTKIKTFAKFLFIVFYICEDRYSGICMCVC